MARKKIKRSSSRRIQYVDVERYFRYTRKYVTSEFYLDMKQRKDVDDVRNSQYEFFSKVIKKDSDMQFLLDILNYDYMVRQYQKLVLEMKFVKDSEQTKKRISINKLIEQERQGAAIVKSEQRKIETEFVRRKYTEREVTFLRNKLNKGTEKSDILFQYNAFLVRNNLSLRSENAVRKKMRAIENEK